MLYLLRNEGGEEVSNNVVLINNNKTDKKEKEGKFMDLILSKTELDVIMTAGDLCDRIFNHAEFHVLPDDLKASIMMIAAAADHIKDNVIVVN